MDFMSTFFKKGLGVITGAGDLAATKRALTRNTSATLTRARAAAIPRRRNQIQLPSDSDDPSVRFRVAMTQYGVDDAGLNVRLRAAARMFSVCGVFGVMSVGMCAGFAAKGSAGVWAAIQCGCLSVLMLCLCIRYGHGHWQLRTRRLGSVREYVCTLGAWIPAGREGRA